MGLSSLLVALGLAGVARGYRNAAVAMERSVTPITIRTQQSPEASRCTGDEGSLPWRGWRVPSWACRRRRPSSCAVCWASWRQWTPTWLWLREQRIPHHRVSPSRRAQTQTHTNTTHTASATAPAKPFLDFLSASPSSSSSSPISTANTSSLYIDSSTSPTHFRRQKKHARAQEKGNNHHDRT